MVRRISFVIAVLCICILFSENVFAQSSAFKNAEALILKGEYQQAIRECEKILANYDRRAIKSKAYYLMGICFLEEANYEQARKNFDIILRRYKNSKFYDDASLGIADSYLLAGDYEQANKRYKQFLQDFPRSELINIARRHFEQYKQGAAQANSYFSVQVGSFTSKRNAEKLREELVDGGYQAYILERPGEGLYRVRVGKFDHRKEAEYLERRLRSAGYPTKISP